MKKIFIVTDGCYSDYKICAAFSTRGKAEEFCEKVGAASIEEFEIDSPEAELATQGYRVYYVCMLRDGEVTNAYAESRIYIIPMCGIYRLIKDQVVYMKDPQRGVIRKDALVAYVWAKSEEHAVKIVNEKRTQMIALGEWEGV